MNRSYASAAPIIWFVLFMSVFIWSAIQPHDYFTWFLEVIPAVIGFIILALTRQKSPLTTLVYCLILLHMCVLMIGGHYTYAEVPLFNWLKDEFNLARNNYDKVGHFIQGFVPAMIAREIVIRQRVINGIIWQAFFITCFCLALSAVYELIEWGVAVASGEGADSFLGTQGYVWDTQSDMAYCLAGAVIALLTLSQWHNKQLESL